MYDFQPIRHNDGIATWLIAEYRMFLIQKYPLCFYVWGYAPYNPSTANQLKCSSLRSIISLDSWFRLFIPCSQLTLALWNNNPDKCILYRLNERLLIHHTSDVNLYALELFAKKSLLLMYDFSSQGILDGL